MDDVFTLSDRQRLGREWMERIEESEKREEKWMKDAEKAEAAYLCDSKESGNPVPEFNILHSNVETIVPAIYNSTPRPEIRPRHTRDDKIGKYISDVHEKAITTLIDDGVLDAEIEGSAQDGFMAGRGIVRIKMDADVAEVVESGSSVMKLISPSEIPSSELFICSSERANIFLSAVSASYWRVVHWDTTAIVSGTA